MTEIIADLDTIVTSPTGTTYFVQVAAEQLAANSWEAWLEFVPTNDELGVLLTPTETTQSTRNAVLHWSGTLTPLYLEAALARAREATEGRRLVRTHGVASTLVSAPFDPFSVFPFGLPALRARLSVLTRSELVAIIQEYGLNPAGKGLTRLSDAQLVTFIVTAVDVQMLKGTR